MEKQKRPQISITPMGAFVFWLALLAVPFAIAVHSGSILILALLGLALVGMARFLARRQLQGLELKRGLPTRTFLGQTFQVEVMIRHQRRSLSSREIDLKDYLVGRATQETRIEELPVGKELALSYPAKVIQRGRIRVEHYELSSRWPFGLFEAKATGRFSPLRPGDETMLVAPKPVLPTYLKHILQQIEQETALYSEFNPDDPSEFRALREFRPGDPLKSIHWSASSRSDSLIVRESDPPTPRPQSYGIFLHQYVPPGELYQPDRFEKMLRIACGLLLQFWKQQVPVVVRMEFAGRRKFLIPERDHYHAVLDALAECLGNPKSSLHYLEEDWEMFEACDQVFVLGDWQREAWQDKVQGQHTSVICLDPTTGIARKRNARVLKPNRKIATK